MKKILLWGIWAWLVLAAAPCAALEARKLAPAERISIDGRLDESAWASAPVMDRFWEFSPRDNVEAGVRTEARFLYDRHALYVGLRMFDPDMGAVRAPFARRDNVLADQDYIILLVDPVGSRKFAHFFRVNPRGSVGDGLWNDDTTTEDFSPDIEFEVVTGRFEGGWTAEFAIPFSSLRYGDPPSREWSVMVMRNYPRDQRYRSASSRLARDWNCLVCLNDPLTGLDDLPSARHLQLTPNATVRSVRTRTDGVHASELDVVPSLDLKWRPRADIIVDATINPDFSQVELDTPQLSGNTQFALFYPEKRPFFLEGADILEAPMRAIYTRSVTDPAWGVRATQRSSGFDGTVLVTRDDGGGLVLLPHTYGTRFARQDFKSMATFARGRWQAGGMTVGGLFTDRTLENDAYNRVVGPDVAWFPNTENRVRAQLLGSWTTAQPSAAGLRKGELETGHAALLDWSYKGPKWDQYVNVEDVGRDFRADNGFIAQSGYRRVCSETVRKFVGLWGLNEVSPYLFAEYKVDPSGNVQYQQNNVGTRWVLPRATTVWTEVRVNNLIAVSETGGLRKRDQLYVGFESNPFPWLARLYAEVAWGDRLDVANNRIGKGAFATLQFKVRPHARAELEYRVDNDHIESREAVEGSRRILNQRIHQLLGVWHLSASDSVRTIWQSSTLKRAPSLWVFPVGSREDSSTLSIVYGHVRGIGTSFYVGATFSRDRDADAGSRRYQAEAFVKASWSFDVL